MRVPADESNGLGAYVAAGAIGLLAALPMVAFVVSGLTHDLPPPVPLHSPSTCRSAPD